MKIEKQHIILQDGSKFPRFGLGTFLMNKDTCAETVFKAITELGVRHIDTAHIYGNEELVGEGIKKALEAGVKREDLWVTTKLWLDQKNNAEGALRSQLAKLQLDYVDLFLIHWPYDVQYLKDTQKQEMVPLHVTWANLENCVKKGLTKHIGVSNFNC